MRSLQSDSQKFTLEWIDNYQTLKNVHLENLEPIVSGSKKQHLNEARYKKEKLIESIQVLEERHVILENKATEKRNEIEMATNHMNDLKSKSADMQKEFQNIASRLEGMKERENTIIEKEKQIIGITKAPDLKVYSDIQKENILLKDEISYKDKIIETLKEKIEIWKENFEQLAKHLGNKILSKLGFESIVKNDYPTKKSIAAFKDLKDEMKDIHTSYLRVIPDRENKGMFQIVNMSKKGEFTHIQGGFKNREEAYKRRDEIVKFGLSYIMKKEEKIKERI